MPEGPRGAGALIALLGLTAAIGWADLHTGPHFSFSLLYILPILAASWWLGSSAGMLAALTASAGWLVAELAWPETPRGGSLAWNTLTRWVVFLLLAVLTGRVRRERLALAQANASLRDLAAREASLARTDPLTGLLNARAFREVVRAELRRTREAGGGLCVALLDLDEFKSVNDSRGHGAGDQLLRHVGLVVRHAVRASDWPARIGGDEFAVLFHDADPEAAERLARGLGQRLRGAESGEVRLRGASIGLACFDRPPDDPDTVMAAADRAMYKAKATRAEGVVVWREGNAAAVLPAVRPTHALEERTPPSGDVVGRGDPPRATPA